jgi:hypothetical protein
MNFTVEELFYLSIALGYTLDRGLTKDSCGYNPALLEIREQLLKLQGKLN